MSLIEELTADVVEAFDDLDDVVFNFTISYSSGGTFVASTQTVTGRNSGSGSWRGVELEFTEKDLRDLPVGKTVIGIMAIASEAPFVIDTNVNYTITVDGKKYITHKIKRDPAKVTYALVCIEA
jgi:hypothetical protein